MNAYSQKKNHLKSYSGGGIHDLQWLENPKEMHFNDDYIESLNKRHVYVWCRVLFH